MVFFSTMFCTSVLVLIFCSTMTESVTGPTDTGDGNIYRLEVTQDVFIERNNRNFNYLKYLIVGEHPQYPLKRSLLQFEDLPSSCKFVKWAKMYVYYVYAHKASWHSVSKSPFISRPLQLYQVKQSWSEMQATSGNRLNSVPWNKQYLGLDDTDAYSTGILPSPVTIFTSRPKSFIEFDVTKAMCNWKHGSPNYGLLLMATNEKQLGRDIRFYSNQHNEKDKHAFINVLCD